MTHKSIFDLHQSCFRLYCHSSSPVLVLNGPSPCMNSGEQLSRAWPEVLCGSAMAGCNSSTLKPLSEDSSECLRCGSLDSLHPFCSFTPFSFAFCLPLFFEFSHSHTKRNCPHPIRAVVSKHTTLSLPHFLCDERLDSHTMLQLLLPHKCWYCLFYNVKMWMLNMESTFAPFLFSLLSFTPPL